MTGGFVDFFDGWGTGWSSAFLTSEAGITVIATPTISTIATAQGGTGINTSASTGVPQISSGAWSICNPTFTAINITSHAGTAAIAGCYNSNWTVSLNATATTTVTLTGLVNGATVDIEALQDAAGGNTITMAGSCTWRGASGGGSLHHIGDAGIGARRSLVQRQDV